MFATSAAGLLGVRILNGSDRASSGLTGLDDILGGGFILGRLHLVEGKAGTCKTTLGMQFVLAGRDRGEKGWVGPTSVLKHTRRSGKSVANLTSSSPTLCCMRRALHRATEIGPPGERAQSGTVEQMLAEPSDGCCGKAARWALEAKVVAQSRAAIIAPEQAARLQFWDHQIDEIVKPARQIGRLHEEPVDAVSEKPFLHVVGDLDR
jgi:hypothetical protein